MQQENMDMLIIHLNVSAKPSVRSNKLRNGTREKCHGQIFKEMLTRLLTQLISNAHFVTLDFNLKFSLQYLFSTVNSVYSFLINLNHCATATKLRTPTEQ